MVMINTQERCQRGRPRKKSRSIEHLSKGSLCSDVNDVSLGRIKQDALKSYQSALKSMKLTQDYEETASRTKNVKKMGRPLRTKPNEASPQKPAQQEAPTPTVKARLELFSYKEPMRNWLAMKTRTRSPETVQKVPTELSQADRINDQTKNDNKSLKEYMLGIASSVSESSMIRLLHKMRRLNEGLKFRQQRAKEIDIVLIPKETYEESELHNPKMSYVLYFGLIRHLPLFELDLFMAHCDGSLKGPLTEHKQFPAVSSRPTYSMIFNKLVYYVAEGDYPKSLNRYWIEHILFSMGCKVEVDEFEEADILIGCRDGINTGLVDPIYRAETKRTDFRWLTDSILSGKLLENDNYLF